MERAEVSLYIERAEMAGALGEFELKIRVEQIAADESGHARELERLFRGLG